MFYMLLDNPQQFHFFVWGGGIVALIFFFIIMINQCMCMSLNETANIQSEYLITGSLCVPTAPSKSVVLESGNFFHISHWLLREQIR